MILSNPWEFHDFVNENGNNLIERWRKSQREETQLLFDETLDDCRGRNDPETWARFKWMSGRAFRKYNIWQIGFKSENRHYRVWGIFEDSGSNRKYPVVLGAGYHKESYEPRGILDRVPERAKLRGQGGGGLCERKSKNL